MYTTPIFPQPGRQAGEAGGSIHIRLWIEISALQSLPSPPHWLLVIGTWHHITSHHITSHPSTPILSIPPLSPDLTYSTQKIMADHDAVDHLASPPSPYHRHRIEIGEVLRKIPFRPSQSRTRREKERKGRGVRAYHCIFTPPPPFTRSAAPV